ncbi:PAS domain S-box protein [Aquipseudomonas campi]
MFFGRYLHTAFRTDQRIALVLRKRWLFNSPAFSSIAGVSLSFRLLCQIDDLLMSYLTSLFVDTSDPGLFLYGTYNTNLVLLSVLVAIFASGMALQVAGMARLSKNPLYRQVALITGSLALGGGVWSMHFIGMLAFQLCTRIDYDPGLTLLSLLPSLAASWVALHLLVRQEISPLQLITGGVLVGAGIGAMHYSGMAAMQMAPLLRYDPLWFGLSIVVAVVLAIISLWIRFGLRGHLSAGKAIIVSAVVMGIAISAMHYIGMAAARFIGVSALNSDQGNADSVFLAVVVSLITVMLTIMVAGANGLLRYRQLYRHLQDNESRLRAVLHTAVDGIITIDERGSILGMNQSTEVIFGWSSAELLGHNISELMPEPYRSEHDDYLSNFQRTGIASIIGVGREVEGRRKDGSLVPIRLAIGKANIPGQTVYVGFISDITERKSMERALRESEQQYRSLIRNIPGVSFRCLLDENWTMLFISEAVEKLTGWPPEIFVEGTLHFADLMHPDDREGIYTSVQEAIATGLSYVVEYRLKCRDGTERWVWESGGVVSDQSGQTQWIDGVILDITESKLRNSEFEGTVKAISRALAVVEFDMDGTIRTANQNWLDLVGYSLGELEGRHHSMFCGQAYVDSQAYADFWAGIRAGEVQGGEFLRLGRTGKEVWIQATYNPIFNIEGKPFKVVKFATDTSQRHEMEQQLRDAKTRAEQAAEVKTTFLANMSHEIRTPMNAIIGFTELLMSSSLDSMQQRHLGTVRHAARSLLGLLNDILDTAKLEKGALELEHVDFSLRELCEHICASLRLEAQSKGLTLTLDYHAMVGEFFKGDPLRIQQVLTNLVGNAVKFTEHGWIRLEVTLRAGRVHFAVQDSGIGIAPDRLERIFDPFAQADASMSRRFGGTGLGTTIARQLVWLMEGTINVESRLGEGSTFHVELPLPVGKAIAGDAQGIEEGLAPLRILAADDVPQNIELLALALGQLGHDVVTATDGDEAVTCFLQGVYDVVLMDVQMPRTDGLEATRRIRRFESDSGAPRTPVIALTASVLDEDRRAAREAGMDGFASKPLELNKLLEEIARVISGSAASVPVANEQSADGAVGSPVDWAQGVRLWGDISVLNAAIQRFRRDNATLSSDIQMLLGRNEVSAATELAHRVRGASANLALVHLSRLTGKLERALKAGELNAANELVSQLQLALDDLSVEMETTTPPDPERPSCTRVALADLPPLIESVRSALQHGELADAALAMLGNSLPELGQEALYQALESALHDFDFEHAEGILTDLLAWVGQVEERGPL